LPQLISYLSQNLQNIPYEILVITSDKTKQPLPSLPALPNIHVYKSYGDTLERAILLGFSVAAGNKIVVMDADGSHPPHQVPAIYSFLDSYEMVVASRFIRKAQYHNSFFRYIVSYLFTEYAKLFGSTLSDPMSGYFGIQAQLLTKMSFKPYKWKTCLEIHNKLHPSTFELPYCFEKRKLGARKSNWKIALSILWNIAEEKL
jgi:dolichol-phosphate mannosyltransferase